MPASVTTPAMRLRLEPLTPVAFAPFGTVIENPERTGSQQPGGGLEKVAVNQGSALKYLDVTHMTNLYHQAISGKPAKAVMNMFVCSPRTLRDDGVLEVSMLERHPFTSQTFVPMMPRQQPAVHATPSYLVIVAPTLPAVAATADARKRPPPFPVRERSEPRRSVRDVFSHARPSPFDNETVPAWTAGKSNVSTPLSLSPKGSGLPDLGAARAFVATGHQAVTYAAGTWHAPMCVLGGADVDYVVVQFANGVGIEDCQELELRPMDGSDGLTVLIGKRSALPGLAHNKARL